MGRPVRRAKVRSAPEGVQTRRARRIRLAQRSNTAGLLLSRLGEISSATRTTLRLNQYRAAARRRTSDTGGADSSPSPSWPPAIAPACDGAHECPSVGGERLSHATGEAKDADACRAIEMRPPCSEAQCWTRRAATRRLPKRCSAGVPSEYRPVSWTPLPPALPAPAVQGVGRPDVPTGCRRSEAAGHR